MCETPPVEPRENGPRDPLSRGQARAVGVLVWAGALCATVACIWAGSEAFGRMRHDLARRFQDQQRVIAREVAMAAQFRVAEWWPWLNRVEHALCDLAVRPEATLDAALQAAAEGGGESHPPPALLLRADGGVVAAAGLPDEIDTAQLVLHLAGELATGIGLRDIPKALSKGPLSGSVVATVQLPLNCKADDASELAAVLDLADLVGPPMAALATHEGTSAWVQAGEGRILYHSSDPSHVGQDAYASDARCGGCHYGNGALKPDATTGLDTTDAVMAASPLGKDLPGWRILVTTPKRSVAQVLDAGIADLVRLLGAGALFMLGALGATTLVWRRGAAATRRALELHRSERSRLEHILSGLGAGVLAVSEGRQILWANRVAADWFGPVDGLIGGRCHDLLHCAGVPCPECPTLRSAPTERPSHSRQSVRTRDGRLRAFSVTATPVLDPLGGGIQVLHVLQDVTELVDLEQQVARTERLAALGRLAAGVAHEVGNPLTSMSSFIQILRERDHDSFTSASLDKMYGQVQRIAGTVRKLSDLSRADEAILRPVRVDAAIRGALEMVEFDRRLGKIDTELAVEPGLPWVLADAQQLQQVFINLLLNAVDSMEAGGRLEIGARLSEGGSGRQGDRAYVVAWLQDTGTGIPPEVRSRVFDPFFTTKEVGKGTGLGLSISHSIVRSFGGRIDLESEPNEGTRATLWLPVADSEEAN